MGKEVSPNDPEWFMWETPGGGLQSGETLEDCLKREAIEEIGIGIRVKSEMPRFRSFSDPTRYKSTVHWLMIYCQCETIGEPDLSQATDNEFAEIRFVSEEDFHAMVHEREIAWGEDACLSEIMGDLGLWKLGSD